MAPSFRYHVVTITAIFLALGVGTMFGSTFVASAIVDRHTKALAALREQFVRDNQELRTENKGYADFVAALDAYMVQGKLTGSTVAIVQTGDYPDAVRHAREVIEAAGAKVSSVTTLDGGFPTRSQTNLSAVLPKLLETHPGLPADASALLRVMASVLARGGSGEEQILEGVRLLRSDGDYSHANDYVVLIGGASLEYESRAESLDLPLIKLLKDQGATVIEAEPKSAAISYIPMLKGSEISTIDDVDTDRGRICLVLAMRGERGSYGEKSTASGGPLPPVPSPPIAANPGPPATSNDLRRRPGL